MIVDMRLALAAALAAATAVPVSAQALLPGTAGMSWRPTIGLPLPPIGLPLPPLGLPLPPLGLSQVRPPAATDVFHPARTWGRTGRSDRSDRIDQHRPGRHEVATVVYFIPAFGWSASTLGGVVTPAPPDPTPSKGWLRVDLEPGVDPQAYVDGDYFGLLSEFPGGLPLEAGRHAIELRAGGYQPLTIDVRIFEGRAATYRGMLSATPSAPPVPVAPAPQEPPPPAGPAYVIPGCYLGNVAPQDVQLPSGCDPARVIRL